MTWVRFVLVRLATLQGRWLGLIIACVLWLLWMVFGFWATLLLFIMAGLGFVIGWISETKGGWKQLFQQLIETRYRDS